MRHDDIKKTHPLRVSFIYVSLISYDDYVDSLLDKYGPVPNDYYGNEVCLTRSGNPRTREGLIIHHIDEDKEAGLSSMWKYRNPFSMPEEYQKADRLV